MFKHVVCIGGGVIGGGWAARFALAGVDVTVYDPSPAAAATVQSTLANARRAWDKLTLSPPPPEGEVRVIHDDAALAEALARAEFVQESLPEREQLKQQVLAQIEPLMPAHVIIASSTSGLLPSRLQSVLQNPQRFCVSHPFTPVYLLPLVEVCGGEATSAETKRQAAALFKELGMLPLVLAREIDGFVADRLMEALWREALWLVADDVATTADVDDAIRLGCGLRWAFMGPFLTYRLGGGAGGMRHFMQQFAPALKLPWTKLMDTPEMDDALIDKIVAQTDAQDSTSDPDALMRWRDDCLVALMRALAGAGTGVGEAIAVSERRRYAALPSPVAAGAGDDGGAIEAPLRLHTARVSEEWIDYNGHMTESRYLQVFGDTTDALLAAVGVDGDYVAGGRSYYTVETHLRHVAETRAGEVLTTTTQLLAADDKRLHVFHTMFRDDTVVATAEHLLLHVGDGRACAADESVLARVRAIAAAHDSLPAPAAAGRHVGQRKD